MYLRNLSLSYNGIPNPVRPQLETNRGGIGVTLHKCMWCVCMQRSLQANGRILHVTAAREPSPRSRGQGRPSRPRCHRISYKNDDSQPRVVSTSGQRTSFSHRSDPNNQSSCNTGDNCGYDEGDKAAFGIFKFGLAHVRNESLLFRFGFFGQPSAKG